MPGKRNARSRVRGSWAARLTGIGLALLLAAAGIAVYLVVGGKSGQDASALPTRVLSTQAIGLVNPGPPAQAGARPAPRVFLTSRPDLGFVTGPSGADWTADQMAGGTYIFIYLPNGQCLASVRASAVALARCNLGAGQRWVRQHLVSAGGLDYWQLRNLSSGRCLTAASGGGATQPGRSVARLERCQAPANWRQLVAFMTAP